MKKRKGPPPKTEKQIFQLRGSGKSVGAGKKWKQPVGLGKKKPYWKGSGMGIGAGKSVGAGRGKKKKCCSKKKRMQKIEEDEY